MSGGSARKERFLALDGLAARNVLPLASGGLVVSASTSVARGLADASEFFVLNKGEGAVVEGVAVLVVAGETGRRAELLVVLAMPVAA